MTFSIFSFLERLSPFLQEGYLRSTKSLSGLCRKRRDYNRHAMNWQAGILKVVAKYMILFLCCVNILCWDG
jgi:hypothetical protein